LVEVNMENIEKVKGYRAPWPQTPATHLVVSIFFVVRTEFSP
jgi:hypothetical protein